MINTTRLLCFIFILGTTNFLHANDDKGSTTVDQVTIDQSNCKSQDNADNTNAEVKSIEILDIKSEFFKDIVNIVENDSLPKLSNIVDSEMNIYKKIAEYENINDDTAFFGRINVTKISNEALSQLSDAAQQRIINANRIMNETFEARTIYTLNEIKNIIDRKLPELSMDEILSLARGFRHVNREGSKFPNEMGDYVTEYILTNAIKQFESEGDMNEEKRAWFSTALYELSQVYSHLIDFNKVNFYQYNTGVLKLSSLYLGNQIGTRRYEIKNFELNGATIQYEDVIFHKLILLKNALIYNNNNFNAVNRLMEYIYHDIENSVMFYVDFRNKFYNSLIVNFKFLEAPILSHLKEKFNAILSSNDVIKVDYKTNHIIKNLYKEASRIETSKMKKRKRNLPDNLTDTKKHCNYN